MSDETARGGAAGSGSSDSSPFPSRYPYTRGPTPAFCNADSVVVGFLHGG